MEKLPNFWNLDLWVCLKKLGLEPDLYGKSVLYLRYRTRAIITRGLYLFYPIFHCGLYLRAVNTAERLVFT